VKTVTAGPTPRPINLTLPTKLYIGNGAGAADGAALSPPSSPPGVSWRRTLAINRISRDRLTGKVLADATMPGSYYEGKPVTGLACWVYVFTEAKPYDLRAGLVTPIGVSSTATPPPLMVWHNVVILNASNGHFVIEFLTVLVRERAAQQARQPVALNGCRSNLGPPSARIARWACVRQNRSAASRHPVFTLDVINA